MAAENTPKTSPKLQTEKSELTRQAPEVSRKGNIETTKKPNGTVIVNATGDQ